MTRGSRRHSDARYETRYGSQVRELLGTMYPKTQSYGESCSDSTIRRSACMRLLLLPSLVAREGFEPSWGSAPAVFKAAVSRHFHHRALGRLGRLYGQYVLRRDYSKECVHFPCDTDCSGEPLSCDIAPDPNLHVYVSTANPTKRSCSTRMATRNRSTGSRKRMCSYIAVDS
jgi:hypothetical protein